MSDQSLRDALETIARGGVPLGISPAQWAAAGVFRKPPTREQLDQLWGWAKSGETRDSEGGEYYLMSKENVDGFTDAVLNLIHNGGAE